MRAEYNGCKLILGSATPSVESYKEAVEGNYNLVTLPERINKRPMPEIVISDMRKEVKRGNPSPFSAALREELDATLKSGNQAIIFLNRRGYSQKVICRDCGYVAKCENCDVSLTYHSEEDCLKCHYCGTRYRMLPACPDCGGVHIRYSGTGTQRVVEELSVLFPASRIIRMDNDTVSGKDGHYKNIKQIRQKGSRYSRWHADDSKRARLPRRNPRRNFRCGHELAVFRLQKRRADFPAHNSGRGQKRQSGYERQSRLATYCPETIFCATP